MSIPSLVPSKFVWPRQTLSADFLIELGGFCGTVCYLVKRYELIGYQDNWFNVATCSLFFYYMLYSRVWYDCHCHLEIFVNFVFTSVVSFFQKIKLLVLLLLSDVG